MLHDVKPLDPPADKGVPDSVDRVPSCQTSVQQPGGRVTGERWLPERGMGHAADPQCDKPARLGRRNRGAVSTPSRLLSRILFTYK